MIPALQQLVRASQEARRPGERVLSILLVYIAEVGPLSLLPLLLLLLPSLQHA